MKTGLPHNHEARLKPQDRNAIVSKDIANEARARRSEKDTNAFPRNTSTTRTARHEELILHHKPSCSETLLSLRLAKFIDRSHSHQSWHAYLPGRIGHYHSLDLALSAFLDFRESPGIPDFRSMRTSLRCYHEAVGTIRSKLDSPSFWSSEEALLTVAVLSECENTKGADLRCMNAHKHGLLALFSRSTGITEPARALIYDECGIFLMDCVRGVKSRFDTPYWLDLLPSFRIAPTPAVCRLRKIGYQLCIRLPGLICLVRSLRNNPSDLTFRQKAIRAALDLWTLGDKKSENELLHSVSVTKLHRAADGCESPIGMKFRCLAELEACAKYWQTKIMVFRLCSYLQKMFAEQAYFSIEAINTENCRMISNLIMTFRGAFDLQSFGIVRGGSGTMSFFLALITMWGILQDMDTFHGYSSSYVRAWILRQTDILVGRGVSEVSSTDMDEMADLFVGGPVQGLLPRLLGQTHE